MAGAVPCASIKNHILSVPSPEWVQLILPSTVKVPGKVFFLSFLSVSFFKLLHPQPLDQQALNKCLLIEWKNIRRLPPPWNNGIYKLRLAKESRDRDWSPSQSLPTVLNWPPRQIFSGSTTLSSSLYNKIFIIKGNKITCGVRGEWVLLRILPRFLGEKRIRGAVGSNGKWHKH